jgi:hypothetical protein
VIHRVPARPPRRPRSRRLRRRRRASLQRPHPLLHSPTVAGGDCRSPRGPPGGRRRGTPGSVRSLFGGKAARRSPPAGVDGGGGGHRIQWPREWIRPSPSQIYGGHNCSGRRRPELSAAAVRSGAWSAAGGGASARRQRLRRRVRASIGATAFPTSEVRCDSGEGQRRVRASDDAPPGGQSSVVGRGTASGAAPWWRSSH